MSLKTSLGRRIQYLRKSRNITQEKLAEQINMDITSLSKIETGRNYPHPDTLEKIAKALDIEICHLFSNELNFSKEDYLSAIYKNISYIKENRDKLKLLYSVTSAII